MTWEEFNDRDIAKYNFDGQELTEIKCPKCGEKIYYDSTITLTSYPPQYKYWCKCGWCGTSYRPWKGITIY